MATAHTMTLDLVHIVISHLLSILDRLRLIHNELLLLLRSSFELLLLEICLSITHHVCSKHLNIGHTSTGLRVNQTLQLTMSELLHPSSSAYILQV